MGRLAKVGHDKLLIRFSWVAPLLVTIPIGRSIPKSLCPLCPTIRCGFVDGGDAHVSISARISCDYLVMASKETDLRFKQGQEDIVLYDILV